MEKFILMGTDSILANLSLSNKEINMLFDEVNDVKKMKEKNGKGYNLYEAIWLLAKEQLLIGKDKLQMIQNIEEWMKQSKITEFDEIKHARIISNICHKVLKYNIKPIVIDCIYIGSSELEIIKNLNSPPLERLAFGYLVNAKIINKKKGNFNSLVDKPLKKIFREIGMKSYSTNKQEVMVYSLIQQKILELGNISFENLQNKVLILDENVDDTNYKIKISHFQDYILHYNNYVGNGKYSYCEICGKIVKKKSANSRIKYCNECAEEIKKEQDSIALRKFRAK